MTATYPPLAAYRVHRSDGTSYVTNMAAAVTLADARAYFLGKTFTDECPETGRETTWRCVGVTELSGSLRLLTEAEDSAARVKIARIRSQMFNLNQAEQAAAEAEIEAIKTICADTWDSRAATVRANRLVAMGY